MSVSAFTNAVGFYSIWEPRASWLTGISDWDYNDDYDSYRYIHYAQDVRTEWSWKSDTQKSDHVLPSHYYRGVRKVLKDTPAIAYRRGWGGGHLVYEETYETYLSHVYGTLGWEPDLSHIEDNAKAESEVRALNNLAAEKASLGAEFAQARQTIEMFSSNASQLARALLAAKRGRWDDIPGILGLSRRDVGSGKTLANRWLETQYGWLPLMSTLHETQGVIHQILQKKREVVGIGKGSGTYRNTIQDGESEIVVSSDVKSRASLTARLNNDFLHNLDSAGLLNPLSVAWELVPWSFAIDWFVPIGATLEATTATFGLDFVRGYRTRKKETNVHRQFLPRHESEDDYNISNGEYEEVQFWMERYPYDTFPSPDFYADMTPFSTPRALNALALIRQLFR